MAITDELREWFKDRIFMANGWQEIHDIADRIDREHERAMADAELAAAPTEAQLEEWGYVKLPVDVDGVPIHVGDVMEVKFDTKRRPFTVSFVGERAVAFWVVGQPDLKSFNLDTVLVTHYHAPTVEDVLDEFANAVLGCDNTEDSVQRVIAEYAAKLRLAEEVDA